MGSEFNNWYEKWTGSKVKCENTDIIGAWQHQQSKIDELQKGNDALVHVIKSRDIQLENEKHEYDELMNKLVDSGMKNAELQKRMDAVKQLIEEYRDPPTEDKTFQHALSIVAYELE